MKSKVILITPFVSLILFLVTWLVFDRLTYGFFWFLLLIIVPLVVYINPRSLIRTLYQVSLCLVYITLSCFGLWEYSWIALALIPLFDFYYKKSFTVVRILNILVLVCYVLLGFLLGKWHPNWIIFLLLPIIHILFSNRDNKYFCNKLKDAKYVFYHEGTEK